MKAVTEQLETSRTKAKAAVLAFRQLKEEMTDSLRLRGEKCWRRICYVGSPNFEVAEIGLNLAAIDEHENQQNRMASVVS